MVKKFKKTTKISSKTGIQTAKQLSKQQSIAVDKETNKQLSKRPNNKIHEKILIPISSFGSEFKKQTSTAIIAAFGFLIALSWRDLIQKAVQENLHTALLEKYPYLHLLYTAIIITLISVLGIALVSRWAKAPEK